jgi:Family of unknown function (DUF5762)
MQNPTIKDKTEKPPIPFWSEDPNVIFDKETMLEFYPTEHMTYNQKLNAISRTVLVLTILFLLISPRRIRTVMMCMGSLVAVWALHHYHTSQEPPEPPVKEGLEVIRPSPALDYLKAVDVPTSPTMFQEPTSTNPFSNVMMSDYDYNPNKLPAPPMSNADVNDLITQNAKRLVQEANPGQPNIDQKLFKDLTEQLNFEQSMRQFHSTPATTIPNDQGSFAEFCYGSMLSCKEGNLFACARNTSHYTNY